MGMKYFRWNFLNDLVWSQEHSCLYTIRKCKMEAENRKENRTTNTNKNIIIIKFVTYQNIQKNRALFYFCFYIYMYLKNIQFLSSIPSESSHLSTIVCLVDIKCADFENFIWNLSVFHLFVLNEKKMFQWDFFPFISLLFKLNLP